jgi:hypothetical protein
MNIGTDKIKRAGTSLFFCAIVPDNVCGQLHLILLYIEILIDYKIEYDSLLEALLPKKT